MFLGAKKHFISEPTHTVDIYWLTGIINYIIIAYINIITTLSIITTLNYKDFKKINK